ncbi:hypothetical protein CC80DRAFT_545286 [Byssothecium circinans]|uniref:Mid2 domain-containing protein n=1 Tax=Byssothecium circinans TaxID=147558 RepID=A0A6A5UAH5_9PLEO|nr:hypothetical protein CC80DRAFT_545286 [Byssothecium circinans]
MPTLYQPKMLKRAVADPNALTADLAHLVVRASKKGGKKGSKKGKKAKVKGGTIVGVITAIVAIIIIVIIIAIISFLVKRNRKKRAISAHEAEPTTC